MFKVVNTGKKTHQKSWKRMITKPTFVGSDFTRRPVKYERFIRPMGLRYKKANVTQYVSSSILPALKFSAHNSSTAPSSVSPSNCPSCPSRRTPRTPCTLSWVF
jgi:hypothetical protein